MSEPRVTFVGGKELQAAIARSPQFVATETGKLLTRAMSKYKKGILMKPWEVGGAGGGAPKKSGNLRDTHVTRIDRYSATIGPGQPSSKYAKYVHDGTPGGQMKGRPWLDWVKEQNESRVQSLYREFLKNVIRDLAR